MSKNGGLAEKFKLTGKVCLVTGGSRGMGLEMCRAFAQAGASIVVSSRKQAACDQAAQQITAATGARCLPVACHVGDWTACDALVERAWREFGRIDVLVNNAGMSPLYDKPSAVTRELWDKVIGVNLAGPYRLAVTVAERMAAGEGGSIINISSTSSMAPGPIEMPYAAAKAGLNNLTQSLAHTYAPKVRTNCIVPGPFLTDISKAWPDSFRDAVAGAVPLGRAGEPEEIAGLALYLASDASSYTNGAMIKLDGGMVYG